MRDHGPSPDTSWWQFLAAGVAYAILSTLAFPPASLWPIAFVAPLPLVWAACRARGRWFVAGFWTGVGTLPFWFFEHLYLMDVTAPGYPGLCLYLAVYPALAVILTDRLLRFSPGLPAAIGVPLCFTGLELLRGEVVLTGYPWFLAGQPLIDVPLLASPAAVGSVYFVSLLVLGVAGAAGDAAGWSGRQRRKGGVLAAAWMGLWIASALTATLWPTPASQDLRVAAVQTNIPQSNKLGWGPVAMVSDFRRFVELTRGAAVDVPRPDVILWPETMFPGRALNPGGVAGLMTLGLAPTPLPGSIPVDESETVTEVSERLFYDRLLRTQSTLGVPMLVGAIAMDRPSTVPVGGGRVRITAAQRFNSAFLIAGGEVQPVRYDKIDLTPFGEVIPYVWRWPSLQNKILAMGAAGMSFDLGYGAGPRVLELPVQRDPGGQLTVRLATPICFEVTKPLSCRRLAVESPQGPAAALVNISNDGWFGEFPGRQMHLLCARWRCVELGLPMVRAVNTGLSAAVDRRGRVLALGPDGADRASGSDGVLRATLPMVLAGSGTPFSRVAMAPLAVAMIVLAVLVPVSYWRKWGVRRVEAGPL